MNKSRFLLIFVLVACSNYVHSVVPERDYLSLFNERSYVRGEYDYVHTRWALDAYFKRGRCKKLSEALAQVEKHGKTPDGKPRAVPRLSPKEWNALSSSLDQEDTQDEEERRYFAWWMFMAADVVENMISWLPEEQQKQEQEYFAQVVEKILGQTTESNCDLNPSQTPTNAIEKVCLDSTPTNALASTSDIPLASTNTSDSAPANVVPIESAIPLRPSSNSKRKFQPRQRRSRPSYRNSAGEACFNFVD